MIKSTCLADLFSFLSWSSVQILGYRCWYLLLPVQKRGLNNQYTLIEFPEETAEMAARTYIAVTIRYLVPIKTFKRATVSQDKKRLEHFVCKDVLSLFHHVFIFFLKCMYGSHCHGCIYLSQRLIDTSLPNIFAIYICSHE